MRYEDLVDQQEKTINKTLDFIGLGDRSKSNGQSYFERIPNNQKHLHTNVKGGGNNKSLEKWATRLSYSEKLAINALLKNELAIFKYPELKLTGFKFTDIYIGSYLLLSYFLSKLRDIHKAIG